MLPLSIDELNALAAGKKPVWKVKVYFQEPEIYTKDDYLQSEGDISTSMSRQGGYAIENTTIELKNSGYYFSEKFEKEMPDKKLVEIFIKITDTDKLVSRLVVGSWELTPSTLTLDLNA